MNYTRRPTRPDSLYYRETRKRPHAPRSGSRARQPAALFIILAVAATALALWLLRP